jgi:DNA-binding transcriptional regulator YiaG
MVVMLNALEKIEGAINNGQSRKTGNVGYTRNRTKTSKAKHTAKKPNTMSNMNITNIRG